MTISANEPRKVTAQGNGSSFNFSFSPMVIFAASDLQVRHVNAAGVETLLTQGVGASNYVVNVTKFPGTGSITYPANQVTPLPIGESLVMKAVLPFEQQTDLENQGGYFPDVQETQFDKTVKLVIQQQEEIERSLRLPISSTGISVELPAPVADQVIGWDATATKLVNKSNPGSISVSTFGQSLIDDTSAAEARTTLDVPSKNEAILDTLVDVKGDIIVATAADTVARKAVGGDNSILISDSTQADGLRWKAGPTGAFVGDSDAQTLTNKTISGAVISGIAPATPTANILYTDSVIKGWVKFDGTGAVEINDDLNVSSITDNGVGDFTINWATAFSSAHYAVVGSTGVSNGTIVTINTMLAASVRISTITHAGAANDEDIICLIAIGDM